MRPRGTFQDELKSDKLGPSSMYNQRNSDENSLDSINRSRAINDHESIFGEPDDAAKERLSDETAADEEDLFFSNPKREFVIFGH